MLASRRHKPIIRALSFDCVGPLDLLGEEALDALKAPLPRESSQPDVGLPEALTLIGTGEHDRLAGVHEVRAFTRVPEQLIERRSAPDHGRTPQAGRARSRSRPEGGQPCS